MLVLTAIPEKCDEICKILLSKFLQALDKINFSGSRGLFFLLSCIILYGQGGVGGGGAVSLLQPPSLVKTLKRLFVIPRLWEGLTFPIGSWSASSGALCPSHLLWFAQLKWDKARGGLWRFTGEFWQSHIQGFFFFLDNVVWYSGTAISSGDWWITLIHTFTQEIAAWREKYQLSKDFWRASIPEIFHKYYKSIEWKEEKQSDCCYTPIYLFLCFFCLWLCTMFFSFSSNSIS